MSTPTELQAALEEMLTRETGSVVRIVNLARNAGGASKEIWRLDAQLDEGAWQGNYPLVLLRPLGGKIYSDALDLRGEFTVMRVAYEAGVPVPRPYWFLDDLLGRPAALMERLEGETIGRRIVKEPSLAEARKCLPEQMGAALAAIHRIDFKSPQLREILPAPAPGQTPIQTQLEQCERDLDRIGEPHPAIELGLRWLRLHEPPPPDHLVLVHGDFRIGNMLVTPRGLNGVLDWEFPHVGDPAEDLSWSLVREWRFGMDHLHFGGIGQPEKFFAAYAGHASHTGRQIDPVRIFYWEVLGNVRWALGTLNQAQRHLSGAEPNLEFASLGRRCAEIELEVLRLIKQ